MPLFARTLVRKGGSLAVTIPFKLANKLGLQEGQQLVFIHDEKRSYAIIGTGAILTAKDPDLKGLSDGVLGLLGTKKFNKGDIELILKELAKEEESEL